VAPRKLVRRLHRWKTAAPSRLAVLVASVPTTAHWAARTMIRAVMSAQRQLM